MGTADTSYGASSGWRISNDYATIANLEPLIGIETVEEAMSWAAGLSDIPEILPAISLSESGVPSVFMPGEAGYEEALLNPPPPGSTA